MKNIVENQGIKTDKPLAMSYEALKAERDALADRVERLSGMLTESRVAAKSAEERANALAVENAGFKHALSVILEHVDVTDKGQAGVVAMIANDELFNSETPATDSALAAMRLEAKIEGANELAERIAEMHSKTAPGSNIEKKLMFAAEAAIAYANGLREAK